MSFSEFSGIKHQFEFPYIFVDVRQKEPSRSVVVKSDQSGIFHGTKFENSFFKSRVVQLRRWPQKVKPAANTQKAISFSGLKSFTNFSVQMI